MKRLLIWLFLGFYPLLSACVRVYTGTPPPSGPAPSTPLPLPTPVPPPAPVPGVQRLNYGGTNPKVKQAVELANGILQNPQFYQIIKGKDKFDFTRVPPSEIADLIKASQVRVQVRLYNGDAGSVTTAYVTPKHPGVLFLNSDKLGRSVGSIISTMIHETVHAVDAGVEGKRFGHGTNDRTGKGNSAPYWIGGLAKCLFLGNANCAAPQGIVLDPEDDIVEEAPDIDDAYIFD